MRRLLLGALALAMIALALLTPAPAQAHTELVTASPAAGDTLTLAPAAVSLTFTDPVIGEVSRVSLRGPDGREHVVGTPSVLGAVIQARVDALDLAGSYRVDYRVVGVDGHPVTGSWEFELSEVAAHQASASAGDGAVVAVGLADAGPAVDRTTLALVLLALGCASALLVRRAWVAVHRVPR